jgi:RNA polymerase sigma-70 factor (ECF subfamily)
MVRDLDDDTLLARVAVGDRGAFETLFGRYYRRLFGFVLRITRRPELVEEAVNDTLLVVWRSSARFDRRSSVSTWILGIAYRKAIQSLARRPRPTEPLPEERNQPVEEREGPLDRLERKERLALVGRALRELSPEQRAVVELTFFHGLSYPEIAAIVECPVNTVKTRMFHARRRLRDILPRVGLRQGSAG